MNLTRITSTLGAGAVAGIAAWSSWSHMTHVALKFGERPEVAYALPLSVDGLLVVAAAAMTDDKRTGKSPRLSARIAFGVGVVASLAANIAAAQPSMGARIVAGWPALALLLVVELLSRTGKRAGNPAPAPEEPQVVPLASEPAAGNPAPALIEPASVEVDLTAIAAMSDPREAARDAYLASVADGVPLSGAALARRFGMSARWGVDQVNAARKVNGNVPDLAEVSA